MDFFDAIHASSSGLSAQRLRMNLISGNLANVSTPGYKRLDVRFAEEMALASRELDTSDPNHVEMPGVEPNPIVEPTPDSDGDFSVDIDREMVAIAENQLRFSIAARLAALRIAGIRASIRGGQ